MFENFKKNNIEIKSSARNFGFTFAIFFGIFSLYPLLFGKNIHTWLLSIALTFLFFAVFIPKILTLPNKLWFKFGLLLNSIVSPIIMALIFYLVVTPTGMIIRLLDKDILRLKFYKSKKSNWIKRKDSITSMKQQF